MYDSLVINTAACWASSNAIIQVKLHLCAYILRSALSAAQPYSILIKTVINLGNSRIIKASPGCPPCLLGSMCCIRQAKYRFDPILRQHDSLLHFLLRSIKRWCLALYTDWLKLNSLKIKFPFKDFNDNFDSYSRLKTRATVFPAIKFIHSTFHITNTLSILL